MHEREGEVVVICAFKPAEEGRKRFKRNDSELQPTDGRAGEKGRKSVDQVRGRNSGCWWTNSSKGPVEWRTGGKTERMGSEVKEGGKEGRTR